jgi:hypothetical protein
MVVNMISNNTIPVLFLLADDLVGLGDTVAAVVVEGGVGVATREEEEVEVPVGCVPNSGLTPPSQVM